MSDRLSIGVPQIRIPELTVPSWSSGPYYGLNKIVEYNGILYKSIQAGVGKQPNLYPDYWTLYDENLGAYTIADPAVNASVLTSIIDGYAGVVVTLTGAPNAQTIQDPTNLVEIKHFMVINDRTSTNNLVITIPLGDTTIEPGNGQNFIWTGSEWVLGSSIDAKNVTAIPSQFNSVTVQGQLDELSDIHVNTYEPTGVVDKTKITVTYDSATRQFTISPTSTFEFYSRGKYFSRTSPESTTAHANTTGVYFLYYDETGSLIATNTMWSFTVGHVPIAYVYYESVGPKYILFDERHGIIMDQATHGHLHKTVGTYVYNWGFALANYTVQPVSPVDSDNQYSIAEGTIADEDLISTITALSAGGPYSVWYRTGASGVWTHDDTKTVPFFSGTYIQYNQYTGATWQLTELATNQYVNVYVLVTPTMDKSNVNRFIQVIGQNVYSTLADAQTGDVANLSLGDLSSIFVEATNIYKITFRTNASYTTIGKCRIAYVQKIVTSKAVINGATNSSHSSLSNLTSDDHPQYPLAEAMSAGVIGSTPPAITNNGNGTFDIASCQVGLFINDNYVGRVYKYTVSAETNMTPPDNSKSYLIVDYNSGSPIYDIITDVELITESSVIPVYTINRQGTDLLYIPWDNVASGAINKAHQRSVKTCRFEIEQANPPILSEFGTRNITITAFNVWHGFVRSMLPAFDSTVNDFFKFYHVAGVWTRVSVTQYENAFYDDGTDLVAATGNKLINNWIYTTEAGQRAAIVLGTNEYTSLSDALLEQPLAIADLPQGIQALGILVGRIIIRNGAAVATLIENAYQSTYSFSPSANFMIKNNPTLSIVASAVDVPMDSKDYVYTNLTLTENVTINNPTGVVAGALLTINFTQDAIGGWSLSWDTYFTNGSSAMPAPTGTGLKSTMYIFRVISDTKILLTSVKFDH